MADEAVAEENGPAAREDQVNQVIEPERVKRASKLDRFFAGLFRFAKVISVIFIVLCIAAIVVSVAELLITPYMEISAAALRLRTTALLSAIGVSVLVLIASLAILLLIQIEQNTRPHHP